MDKIRDKKVLFSLASFFAILTGGGFAFATDGGTSTAVVSALESTASQITSTMASIGPIALGIAGTFLVWRYGMRFFKSISK